jgi:hypothetical protein
MNKKGDVTLKEVIELVIVGLIILAIVWVPWQVINFFRSDRTDATENNFNALVERMKNMPVETRQTYDLYLNSGYSIASFLDAKDATNFIKAPPECKQNCLCLCTVASDKCKAVKCEDMTGWMTFPEKVFVQSLGKPRAICLYKTSTAGKASVTVKPYECSGPTASDSTDPPLDPMDDFSTPPR